MNLTYRDIKNGERIFLGRILNNYKAGESDILKTTGDQYFRRKDKHDLPRLDRRPYIEMYKVKDKIVIVFLTNHTYTEVESTKVIESKIKGGFSGFQKGKTFVLENGQTWQQLDGSKQRGEQKSEGRVMIVNESHMLIDDLPSCPRVKMIRS